MQGKSVADPGFDLRGGVDFVNRGGGGGGRKSLKVLKVEVKVLACFSPISIKIMPQINRERRKN